MSGGSPFLTNGSHIPDIRLKRPDDPRRLGQEPNGLSDVIENRQFAGMCDMVIIGPCEGKIHVLGAGIRSEPNASRSDGRRGHGWVRACPGLAKHQSCGHVGKVAESAAAASTRRAVPVPYRMRGREQE